LKKETNLAQKNSKKFLRMKLNNEIGIQKQIFDIYLQKLGKEKWLKCYLIIEQEYLYFC